MKAVVVTGVSSGIGHAATRALLTNGYRVFGSVRSEADAQRLQAEFGERFSPLVFDVVNEDAIALAADAVRTALGDQPLAGLVNNAGIAVSGPLIDVPPDDFRHQLEVNLVGPLLVTQAFAPLLGARSGFTGEPGRIVNISSIAGQRAMPFLGPYAASKFGLEGFSEALRRELMLFGVDVIVIGPGPVKTAIWDKAEELDLTPYDNSPYLPMLQRFRKMFLAQGRDGYPAERIGELIVKALGTPHPKVRYAAVKGRPVEKLVMALLPKRAMDRLIGKTLRLRRP